MDAIYLYDGQCALCNWGVRYVLKYERAPDTHFVAIQSEKGRALALEHGIDPDQPQSFLYIKNREVYEKSDAAFALGQTLDGPFRWLLWTRVFPKALRDASYSLIARHRYRLFGKYDVCPVPDEDVRHRFVF